MTTDCDYNDFIDLDYNHFKKGKKIEIQYKEFDCGEFDIIGNTTEIFSSDFYFHYRRGGIKIYQSFIRGKFNDGLLKFLFCYKKMRICNNFRYICYIAPFIPYARQKLCNISDLLSSLNKAKVITYDIHGSKCSYDGSKSFLCDSGGLVNLRSAAPLFIEDIKKQYNEINSIVIVFPDKGAREMFSGYFTTANFNIFCLSKIRNEDNGVTIDGDKNIEILKDKKAIIVDDMIDTGKTVIKATEFLIKNGAKSVDIYATHGVFSGNSVKNINNNKDIKTVIVTDSIKYSNSPNEKLPKKIRVIELNPDL